MPLSSVLREGFQECWGAGMDFCLHPECLLGTFLPPCHQKHLATRKAVCGCDHHLEAVWKASLWALPRPPEPGSPLRKSQGMVTHTQVSEALAKMSCPLHQPWAGASESSRPGHGFLIVPNPLCLWDTGHQTCSLHQPLLVRGAWGRFPVGTTQGTRNPV